MILSWQPRGLKRASRALLSRSPDRQQLEPDIPARPAAWFARETDATPRTVPIREGVSGRESSEVRTGALQPSMR